MKNFFLPAFPAGLWLLFFMLLHAPGLWANTTEKNGGPKLTLVPTLHTDASSLSGFTAEVGQFSQGQGYELFWENIPDGVGISISCPQGFRVAGNGQPEVGINLPASLIKEQSSTHIPVFLGNDVPPGSYSGTITNRVGNTVVDVFVSGVVTPLAVPGHLSLIGVPVQVPQAEQGSSSKAANFSLKIENLLNQTPKAVTASVPEFFELSLTEAGPYSESIEIAFDTKVGILVNEFHSIFVRLKNNVAPGSHQSQILFFNPQTLPITADVKGTVTPSNASLSGSPTSLSGFQSSVLHPSIEQNFLLLASGFPSQTVSQFTVVAPPDFEISTDRQGPYLGNLIVGSDKDDNGADDFAKLSQPIFVRLRQGQSVGSHQGDILIINALAGTRQVHVSGEAFTEKPAQLTSGASLITGLSTKQGTASATRNYLLVLKNADDYPGTITKITAPNGFEVARAADQPFSNELEVGFEDWQVDLSGVRTLPVFVRIKASAPEGPVSGSLLNEFGTIASLNIPIEGTVTPAPTNQVNPDNLAFSAAKGTPSLPKTFTVSGSNMPKGSPALIGVTVVAPPGFEVSTFETGPFTDQLTTQAIVNDDFTSTRTLFVRFKGAPTQATGSLSVQMANAVPAAIALTGAVTGEPELVSDPEIIENFAAEIGKVGLVKSYKVKVRNFFGQQKLIVDAPSHFEVSTTPDGVFEDKTNFDIIDGAVDATVYVRFNDDAPEGFHSGNIVQRIGTVGESIVIVSGRVVQVFPVTLVRFAGKVLPSGQAKLEWATTQETNNKGFEVQKSTNSKSFEVISWIDGQGTVSALNEYDYTDESLMTTSYYRLKQIDFDGTSSFSRVVVVAPENESLARLKVWPNPGAGGIFNVDFPDRMLSSQLFDSQGRIIPNWNLGRQINISNQPAGIYLLNVKVKEGIRTIKLIKP